MMTDNTIPILARSGDPLERELCKQVDDLRLVLQPYSEIWFNHVAIRREGDNSRVARDWMNFAGSHYSAIVRVFHSYCAYKTLQPLVLCEATDDDVGRILLEVHREWAAFWEHMGSAIDNLALACEDSVPPVIKKNGREVLMMKYEGILYAYNRRTQFIHSRIVPAMVNDGLVEFRARITETRNRELEPKESRWELQYDSEHVLGDVLNHEWNNFLQEITNAWKWLLSELREKDEGRLKIQEVKFEGLDSADIQRLFMDQPYDNAPISNVEMPPVIKAQSKKVELPSFLSPPPPSGNRPS